MRGVRQHVIQEEQKGEIIMNAIAETVVKFWGDTGIANFTYQNGIMIIV